MTRIQDLASAARCILAGGHWKRRRAESGIASTIGQLIHELESLNQSTERDFLAVGEKLMEFRTSARQISSDMAAVTEWIAGEHARKASQTLEQLLQRSREMDARIEQSGQAFASVREHSTRLRKAFSGLTNMVAVFRSLCTLTQIETARLGGAGADLGHLAAEVRPLSESIQASGEAVVASSKRLDQAVQRATHKGSELRVTQLQEMPQLIASVLASLGSFEERRRLALEVSGRQAVEYAAVCEAIDDLVGSIQFHDITRQQVEHVLEALRRFRSALRGAGTGYSPLETHTVLTLQSSQLAEASRLFAQSIERMDRDLESIGRRLQHASQAVREVAGVSTEGGDSFFLKMEAQFGKIANMLNRCVAAQAEIEGAAASLAETIGGMRASASEIRGTEIQIQRISTNATIRATHIGASGIALNKIAEVMQHLALESNASTEEAAGALEAMSEASAQISRPDSEQSVQEATSGVAAEMQNALSGLHASSESSVERVDHIAKLGAQLAEEIGALRARTSVGQVFADVVGRVRSQLEAMGAEATASSSENSAVAASEQLEHLAKTYTMQRQRDVHESVVGTTATPEPRSEPKAASGESDFGDNVDLF